MVDLVVLLDERCVMEITEAELLKSLNTIDSVLGAAAGKFDASSFSQLLDGQDFCNAGSAVSVARTEVGLLISSLEKGAKAPFIDWLLNFLDESCSGGTKYTEVIAWMAATYPEFDGLIDYKDDDWPDEVFKMCQESDRIGCTMYTWGKGMSAKEMWFIYTPAKNK